MPNPRIQQELTLVDQEYPGYLREFQELMHKGRVVGHSVVYGNCGCFYGWLANLNVCTAEAKRGEVARKLEGRDFPLTPIEHLIVNVVSKDTPADTAELAELDQEIETYFSTKFH